MTLSDLLLISLTLAIILLLPILWASLRRERAKGWEGEFWEEMKRGAEYPPSYLWRDPLWMERMASPRSATLRWMLGEEGEER
jgi:hypothetical protein